MSDNILYKDFYIWRANAEFVYIKPKKYKTVGIVFFKPLVSKEDYKNHVKELDKIIEDLCFVVKLSTTGKVTLEKADKDGNSYERLIWFENEEDFNEVYNRLKDGDEF